MEERPKNASALPIVLLALAAALFAAPVLLFLVGMAGYIWMMAFA